MDNKKLMQDVLAEKLMKLSGGDFQPELGLDPNPKGRIGDFMPQIPGGRMDQVPDGILRYRGRGRDVSGMAVEGQAPKPDMMNPMIMQQALDKRKMSAGG